MNEQKIDQALAKLGPLPNPRNIQPDSLASRLSRLDVGDHVAVSRKFVFDSLGSDKTVMRASIHSSVRIAKKRLRGGEFAVAIDNCMVQGTSYLIAIVTRIH